MYLDVAVCICFWGHKDVLLCKDVSIWKRVLLLNILVWPAVGWCCGSWNLSKKEFEYLRGVQRQMVGKMIAAKKGCWETLEEYHRRRQRRITEVIEKSKAEHWDFKVCKAYVGWAGHVSRMTEWAPRRTTVRVMHYRNRRWLQMQESIHRQQGHGRRFRVWRWERKVYGCCWKLWRRDWEQVAAEKVEWQDLLGEMANYIKDHA